MEENEELLRDLKRYLCFYLFGSEASDKGNELLFRYTFHKLVRIFCMRKHPRSSDKNFREQPGKSRVRDN